MIILFITKSLKILTFILIIPTSIFSQQISAISKAYLKVNEANNTIEVLRDAINNLNNGVNPSRTFSGDWQQLVNTIKEVEEEVNSVDIDKEIDLKLYDVSLSEIQDCSRKNQNISKFKMYSSKLSANGRLVQTNILALDDLLNKLKDSDNALMELNELYRKCMSITTFYNYFAFNWYDLEIIVQPAVSSLMNDVEITLEYLKEYYSVSKTLIGNLTNNLKYLEKYLCSFEGRYTGNCVWSPDVNNDPITLDLVQNGESYSGVHTSLLNYSHANVRDFKFDYQTKTISFSIFDSKYNGVFTMGEGKVKIVVSSGNATCTYSK